MAGTNSKYVGDTVPVESLEGGRWQPQILPAWAQLRKPSDKKN